MSRILFLGLAFLSWTSFTYGEEGTVKMQETFRVVLEPGKRTKLATLLRAPVVKVNRKLGDAFVEGEVLVQLDDRLYEANLVRAEAEEMKAKTDLEGKKQLFSDNIASLSEVKKAEADYSAAIARRVEAEMFLDATVLKAPYDGKVVNVFVEEYELPNVGDELIEIVEDEILIAQILVPSRWLPYVWKQRDFTIRIDETGEEIPARVKRIGAVIDPSSSTIPIEAEVDNTKHELLAGMRGKAIFTFEKKLPPKHKPLTQPDIRGQMQVVPDLPEIFKEKRNGQ